MYTGYFNTDQYIYIYLTSQKNSFPLNPQNQEIHDTSSELLISVKKIIRVEK